jgi:exodeoxyribonuclease III
LLNAPLASQLVEAGVDTWARGKTSASDHAPTWIRLERGAN